MANTNQRDITYENGNFASTEIRRK